MSTAPTLSRYLTDCGAAYDELTHAPTMSSMRTAEACHVPAQSIAKGVVLQNQGGPVLAVLPASRHLDVTAVESQFPHGLRMASEDEIERLFPDCARGAVPPIGAAYGLATICDDALDDEADVYFEGGDHETLVHMSGPAFRRALAGAHHGRFSRA